MIAVTGANGLVGSYVVRELVAQGRSVKALKRAGSDTSLIRDLRNVQWVDANVLDPVSLEEALKDVEAVIHTAAIVSFNPSRKREIFTTNVIGTRHVVDACLSSGVRKLVHISSVAALGRLKGQELIDEKNKW